MTNVAEGRTLPITPEQAYDAADKWHTHFRMVRSRRSREYHMRGNGRKDRQGECAICCGPTYHPRLGPPRIIHAYKALCATCVQREESI